MKKIIICLTIITTVFGTPGLLYAAEQAGADQNQTSEVQQLESVQNNNLQESQVSLDAGSGPSATDEVNEGDTSGAYQQEKSADNSAKKTAGLTGDLKVDQFSGAASYNLGLDVPAGRNGLQSSLNLFYNSHDRSNDSWVGQGWSLELGSIQRSSKHGTNNLYTGNEFTMSLGGSSAELIEVDHDNHLYAPKEESNYLKIQYLTESSSWLITDNLGVKYYLGQTAASRQDDPANQTRIYKWQLDKVQDTNDNFYRVEYIKRSGAIYPFKIYYTGHGTTDGPMEIDFNLEERGQDNSTSYQSQFSVTTDRRLNNIEIKVSNETKNKYQFAYTTGQNGITSLLSSITKKGYQAEQEFSLPATTFTYQQRDNLSWTNGNSYWQGADAFNHEVNHFSDESSPLLDINGDSWTDVGRSFGNASNIFNPNWSWPNITDLFKHSTFADVNGDKYPDLIVSTGDYRGWSGQVYINNKINGFYLSDEWSNALPDFIKNTEYQFDFAKVSFTDINGDGLDDIVYAQNTQDHNHQNLLEKAVYLNTGSGWQAGYGNFPTILASCYADPRYCENSGASLVDINGDGLVDVYTSDGIYLNTGSGWQQQPSQVWTIPNIPNAEAFYKYGAVRFTDINGDGLVDIIIGGTVYNYVNGQNPETRSTYLNTGSGWQLDNNWTLPELFMQDRRYEFGYADLGVRLFDVNNDGLMDLVKIGHNYDDNGNVVRNIRLANGQTPNLLSSISNGYGAVTNLEYQASARFFNQDGSFENPKMPMNLQVVKRITTTDGANNQISTDYNYQDGYYSIDPADYTKNQFTGFGIVTATTADQVVKTYYHQGAGVDGYELGEYDDTIAKKGRVYREEIYKDNAGTLTLQSVKINTWKEHTLDHNRTFVYLDGSVDYDYTQGNGTDSLAPRTQIDKQAIAQAEQAQVLSADSLTQLQAKQNFKPQAEAQLVSESADGLSKTYYLGKQKNGQQLFRYEVYDGNRNSGAAATDEVDNENGSGQYNTSNINDGYVYHEVNRFPNQQETWAQVRDAASGTNVNNNNSSASLFSRPVGIRSPYGLSRVFLPFDTSGLPDDITVTGVSLGLSGSLPQQGQTEPGFYVVNSTQSTTGLSIDDYSRVGNVSAGFIDESSIDNRRANEALNSNAFIWINPTGWTKLALRTAADFTNQVPNAPRTISIEMSESVPAFRPSLTVDFYYNNVAPSVPTDLQVENQSNPSNVQAQQPHFSAIYNDDNATDEATGYRIQVIRAGGNFNEPLWDSGNQQFAQHLPNGQRSSQIQYGGSALPLDGMQYFWRMKFWDQGQDHNEGVWSDGMDNFYMDGSAAPTAPVNLLTEQRINPPALLNQTPSFSAIYMDPNPIDSAKWYRIQVSTSENFSTVLWDSQKTLLSSLVDNGTRSENITYGGDPLAYNGADYYWRIKFWDHEGDNGTEGAWSANGQFSMFNSVDVLDGIKAKAVKINYDFSTGNTTSEQNLGEVKTADNGIFLNTATEVVGDEKNSTYEYAQPTDQSLHILSAPKEKTLSNSNNETSNVAMYYDGLNYGQVQKANETKQDLQVGRTQYQKDFDNYGLVTQTTDPLGQRTTIQYDASNYYPAITTNNRHQAVQTEYDLTTGQIKRTVDPNGLIEERDYDAFGRLTEIRKSDPANTHSLLVLERDEYHDTATPSWAKKSIKVDDNHWKDSYTYFDGLGRKIQTREQNLNGQFTVVSYEYDNKANLTRQTIPYLEAGSAYTAPTWQLNSQPYTAYTYDEQNRVLTETFQSSAQNWQTTYAYDGWNVLITDPLGHQRKLYKDAYGQLIQVDEYLNDQVYSSKYTYNLLGKLTSITDSQNNLRHFEYDSLGRLISQEEMHKPNAHHFGVWTMRYDDASNLIAKTDPKDQTVHYTYDNLNRVLTEDYNGANGIEVSYLYDSATNGRGRLGKVMFGYNDSNSKKFDYDLWGRVTAERGVINGHWFEIKYAYNLNSQPTEIHYTAPEQYYVRYHYNDLGQTVGMSTQEANQQENNIIDNVLYSPVGQIQRISYTNGVVSENTYDPLAGYRLTAKTSIKKEAHLQDLAYTYDAVGNITRIVDASNTLLAKTTNYTYDDLYRLTEATVTGSANNADYHQTYSYDPIGNMLNKSDIGDYLYRNDNPYQANSIAGTNYVFDANGNLTSDANQDYTYNWADRLTEATSHDGSTISDFTYDQNGERVYKKVQTTQAVHQDSLPKNNIIVVPEVKAPVLDQVIDQPQSDEASASTSPAIIQTEPSTTEQPAEIVVPEQPAEPAQESSSTPVNNTSTTEPTAKAGVLRIAMSNPELGSGNKINQDPQAPTSTVETIYPNDKLEFQYLNGNYANYYTITKNLFFGNQRIGQVIKKDGVNTLSLILGDHLGSSSVIINADGNLTAVYDYYPYGSSRLEHEEQGMQVAGNYRYTGKELDKSTDLSYYGARYYAAGIGKFTQVDPAAMNNVQNIIANPQSLNAYAYTENNPVIYTDPDGRSKKSATWSYFKNIAKAAYETLSLSLYSVFPGSFSFFYYNPNVRSSLKQQSSESVNAWATTISDTFSKPSQTWSEALQGVGIGFDEFMNKSDDEQAAIIGRITEKVMEIAVVNEVSGVLSSADVINYAKVPDKAFDTLKFIESKNYKANISGYKGGSVWNNLDENGNNLLPRKANGYYKEWDINPSKSGVDRGGQRLITGADGEAWYTEDHYKTFIKIQN